MAPYIICGLPQDDASHVAAIHFTLRIYAAMTRVLGRPSYRSDDD
jgi:hypothetical protein